MLAHVCVVSGANLAQVSWPPPHHSPGRSSMRALSGTARLWAPATRPPSRHTAAQSASSSHMATTHRARSRRPRRFHPEAAAAAWATRRCRPPSLERVCGLRRLNSAQRTWMPHSCLPRDCPRVRLGCFLAADGVVQGGQRLRNRRGLARHISLGGALLPKPYALLSRNCVFHGLFARVP